MGDIPLDFGAGDPMAARLWIATGASSDEWADS